MLEWMPRIILSRSFADEKIFVILVDKSLW